MSAAQTSEPALDAREMARLSRAAGGRVTLFYLVTSDTLIAFLILPGREIKAFRIAVSQDTVAELAAAVRAGVNADSDAWLCPS